VRFLLDTHVVIWTWQEPSRVPEPIHDQLIDRSNECIVSVASVWELAIKYAAGKLKLPAPPAHWLPQALAHFQFALLDIAMAHALGAAGLPRIHGDPFDRMLIAQAQVEGLTLVTADPVFRQYGVNLHVI